jgi:hypothetical protein
MTPTEKIAKRILVIESLGTTRAVDFWSREKQAWFRISKGDVIAALAKVTATCATTNEDWLNEKVWDIHRKGMLWFMDYLDQENLDRLLDPTIDLFPAAGI